MKKIGLSGVLLAAGLAFAGAAQADVKMGVAGPITGPNASFGAQLTQGVGQAAEDFNKTGGILGQKVEIEQGDDVSDPKQGVSVANKFVGDGVKFVTGHFNSGVTMPSSDVYAENGILEITPASTNPKITDRGLWNVFRTCGRDDQQGQVAGAWIIKNMKGKKVGAQIGTRYIDALKASGAPAEVNAYDSLPDILRDVSNGRLDAGIGDYPILAYNLAQGRFPQLRLVKSYKPSVPGPINIAVKQGNAELLAKINTSLANMKKDGRFETILKKWGL